MKKIPFLQYKNSEWVNAQLSSMTLKEKVGQLFQVAAFSNRDQEHVDYIETLIKEHKIGGLTFFQGEPVKQAELTNQYQALSKVPLFINIDAEWGLGMRLDNTVKFPYQMALGAIQDNELIYQMARQIGKHCKRLGVHSALAPVVDVNNNPNNPVINYRSYGENKYKVAEKGEAYIRGLQDENILDNAKHFPGHGDTSVDSHLDLPVLPHSAERLESLELYPFEELQKAGMSSVMSAHLSIPAWDDRPNVPATLSDKILQGILRDKMGFEGLVITDAMDMHGITNHYPAGVSDKLAIIAGNDIITNSKDVPAGIEGILEAVAQGEITEALIDEKVRKVLAMKQWVGLADYQPIVLDGLIEDLNDQASEELNYTLSAAATTVLPKEENFLPLNKTKKTAFLYITNKGNTVSSRDAVAHHLADMATKRVENNFAKIVEEQWSDAAHYHWNEQEGIEALQKLVEECKQYEQLVISIHGVNIKPFNNFDIPLEAVPYLQQLYTNIPTAFVLFGNAYALQHFPQVDQAATIIVTYQENKFFQQEAVNALLKGGVYDAVLPVMGEVKVL
ncbi:glycoside hydrolase family 3 protein [Algivirga pacifica]|uniref:beta-N-acetylhexosaminidase n=1 Tax=Algivirga pacifica TaxID=1162670 RepID=A0ABP9DC97_9BACT